MVKAIIQLKKHIADPYIYCIIKSKFYYRKKSNPIILLVIDKSSKVNFIVLYCLSVKLFVDR